MKKAILLLSLVCTDLIVQAQTPAIRQVYAWMQQVLTGANPASQPREGGGEIRAQISKADHYIYAVPAVKQPIVWCGIWIHGEYYKVRTEQVSAIPVFPVSTEKDGSREVVQLVPENTGPVVQLLPGKATGRMKPAGSWFQQMIKDNELIIVYIYMGKTWYHPVPKIKMLDVVPAS